jgi:16S rRNA (adenine1518-N6/adenine1519-N6)-dimethyltransferase
VVDPNTIRRIVRLAGVEQGDRVLEIGSGLGSLTLGLVEAGAAVTAVEIDERVAEAFGEATAHRVPLVVGDALTMDLELLVDDGAVVVANLPYNIATAIVLRVLDELPSVHRLLVMVQREVGERLAAPAGSSARGIPSVRVEMWADARMVGTVSPEVFHPRPRVSSALVEIIRRPDVADVSLERFSNVVRTAFGQRRKMLRRSLDGTVSIEELESAGVDPSDRPEQLELAQWVALARLDGRPHISEEPS